MKKNFLYAMIGAIALTGAVGLTSCAENEDLSEVNPNYDPETNSVVVDLALNISTANSPMTRMSSAATQATTADQFRGISDARLFAISQKDGSNNLINGKALKEATTIDKRYDLSQLVTSTQISSTNSRRVLEMSLPLRTNTLVFYGRATKPATGETINDVTYSADESYGALVSNSANNTTSDLADIKFTTAQRISGDKLTEYRKVEKLLAGILSCIINTNLSNVTSNVLATDVAGDNPYGFALVATDINGIKWSDYVRADGKSPYTPADNRYTLEEQLCTIYTQVTTIRGENGELRAASGEAILQTITDIWSAVNKVRCSSPLCIEEAVAKKLASEINDEIKKYFSATIPGDGAAVTAVKFGENLGTIISNFLGDTYWPIDESALSETSEYKRANYGLTGLSTDLAKFPLSYDLPRGASHVKFGVDNHPIFYYPVDFNTSAVGGVAFTVESYLYSPELCYFGNSPMRVSNTSHKTTEYPNGANGTAPTETTVGGWNNESSWSSDWDQNYVTAASRSVAMKNDINYGTALLKTTVKLGATSLKDNNHAVQKSFGTISGTDVDVKDTESGEYLIEPDNIITVDDNSFELVGVIIGGQTRNVGWDFLPKKDGDDYTYGFVVDNTIPTAARQVTTSGSGSNYTLLFDNYKAVTSGEEQEAQEAVYVALEFKNNSGQDFYGNYNLIRQGGTFYLIGQLDPNATSNLTKPNWTSDEFTQYLKYHALPPYDSNGNTKPINRVFMQDFMTTANFTIGPSSLKYAYLTVPDLRSSSLTLGLSVDIKWETGLTFDEIILGGNDY